MKINNKKTQLLCISSRSDSDIMSYINASSERIISSESLKILGFTFGTKPNASAHISKVEQKFGCKIWTLRCLKKARIENGRLLELFNVLLRPVIEYASNAYHPLLTGELSDRIENLQARAMKTIYGWNESYESLLTRTGQSTLRERRERNFDSFAKKTAMNPRYKDWFPKVPNTGHNTRSNTTYHEEFARTERMRNSPVFLMRRRLNQLNAEN